MPDPVQTPWSVYMLRCGDGSLYTGIAIDVSRRVAEHQSGSRGARYLRGRGPLKLVLQAEVGDRGSAARVELRIKRLGKQEKERLLLAPARVRTLLDAAGAPPTAAERAAKRCRATNLTAVPETAPPDGREEACEC
jgi:putative endonuclease